MTAETVTGKVVGKVFFLNWNLDLERILCLPQKTAKQKIPRVITTYIAHQLR